MIPPFLHQIWLGPKPMPEAAMQTWVDRNPHIGHFRWRDDNLPELQNKALFDAFEGVYHAQADILRYELLYNHGGIYVDADSICLRQLDEHFHTPRFWTVAEREGNQDCIANGFLGAQRRDPILAAVIAELGKLDVAAIKAEDREILHGAAWVLTGPLCLREVLKDFVGQFQVYPASWFLPVFHDGTRNVSEVAPYAHHWWGSTHRAYDSPEAMELALKFKG